MARKRDPQTGRLMIEGVHPVISEATGAVTYRGRVSTTNAAGKRSYHSRTFKTYREAADYVLATQSALNRGVAVHDEIPTVAEYWERWSRRKERQWRGSTIYNNRNAWERVYRDRIGDIPITRLTRATCQDIVDTLATELKPSTVRHHLAVLRGMLTDAVRDGYIEVNPTSHLIYPKERKEHPATWTADQARRFLREIDGHRHAPLWTFLLLTGARIGEALALHWRDLDIERGSAHLTSTLAMRPDGRYEVRDGTKTDASGRTVPVDQLALDRLLIAGPGKPDELVFRYRGRPLNPNAVGQAFQRQIRKLGLPRITTHNLRHTAATLMHDSGVPEATVQAILGHESLATTRRYYIHVDHEAQRRGIDALATMLGTTTLPGE